MIVDFGQFLIWGWKVMFVDIELGLLWCFLFDFDINFQGQVLLLQIVWGSSEFFVRSIIKNKKRRLM